MATVSATLNLLLVAEKLKQGLDLLDVIEPLRERFHVVCPALPGKVLGLCRRISQGHQMPHRLQLLSPASSGYLGVAAGDERWESFKANMSEFDACWNVSSARSGPA